MQAQATDLVQRQARALGAPTRHAIFRVIDAAAGPVTVAELTARFGLNHNAIRHHLAKLSEAGLVIEELAPRAGPGRPRLQYRPAPAPAAFGGESPYQQLSLLLLELVATDRSPRQIGAEAGRRLGARAASAPDALAALEELVARQGFEPRRVERRGSVDFVLGHCPFVAAASANPTVVCELHRGLAEGMAEALSGDIEVTDLIARNPKRAGCRLQTRSVQTGPR